MNIKRASLNTLYFERDRVNAEIKLLEDNAPEFTAERIVADPAVMDVVKFADAHVHRHLIIVSLVEEFAEAILAARGKHDHPVRLELVQIAGICIDLIRQIDRGESVELQIPKN